MQISVNGKTKIFESDELTIQLVLQEENIASYEGIAVAINETVIPKNEWSNFQLHKNDRITIIKAVQGG